ncbi:MAG: hypothetical protein ACE5KI_00350 [Dehalococcoidia bacterium]
MPRTRSCLSALLVGALVALISCAGEVERPSTPTPTTVSPAQTATASPTSTSVTAPTPGVGAEIPTGLFLQITNLPKESVVRTDTIPISGLTSPDAVVSVNGVLVEVEADGTFTATVSLEETPNLIEVVASDFQGNQVSAVLTIIYIP